MQNQYLLQHRVFIGSKVQELFKLASVAVDSFVMIISLQIMWKLYAWYGAFYRKFLSKLYPSEFEIDKSYVFTIFWRIIFQQWIWFFNEAGTHLFCPSFWKKNSYMISTEIIIILKQKIRHLPHRLFRGSS